MKNKTKIWFFECFCGIWASQPRSAYQVGAASCKTNWLGPRVVPESAGSTTTLEEPLKFRKKIFKAFLIFIIGFTVNSISSEIKQNNITTTENGNLVINDIIVSDQESDMTDPEFDKNIENPRVTWQDLSGNLWLLNVNPDDRNWNTSNKKLLIDTNLLMIHTMRQGPEWAYDDKGNRIIYTRMIDKNQFQLYQARYNSVIGEWVTSPIYGGKQKAIAKASQDFNDKNPRIIYTKIDRSDGKFLFGCREIDNPSSNTILSKRAINPAWISGKKAVIYTQHIKGKKQIFKYDIYTRKEAQLTFEETNKRFPLMWYDLATQKYILAAVIDEVKIGIWQEQETNTNWSLVNELRPPTKISYVFKPDWFIWNGASYLAYLMHTEKSGQAQNIKGEGEVWITRITGKGLFLHRQANDPNINHIKDVENLVLESKVYIYYTEILSDGRRIIHQVDVGLQSQ